MIPQATTPESLSLSEFNLTAGTQLRAGLDKSAVADYAEAYRDFGGAHHLGKIQIFEVPELVQPYVVIDGFHRIAAAAEVWPAGIELPYTCVGTGTLRQAILQSAGVNAAHGVRRTDADKRRAVLQILSDSEWVNWSDNRIAQTCNVGNRLVGVLRRELIAASETQRLSPRLNSLPLPEVNKAIETIKAFSGDKIIERGGKIFTQKPGTLVELPKATARPTPSPSPLLANLRIYTGPRRLDAKANCILDDGEIVELLDTHPAAKENDIAAGLGIYARPCDQIKDTWLQAIPVNIGDTVPALNPGEPVGLIISYQVLGGTTLCLKFVVDFGGQEDTLDLYEITDRFVECVETDWAMGSNSIPVHLLSGDPVLQSLDIFLELVWYGDPYQFAVAPNLSWQHQAKHKVADYRAVARPTACRAECDIAIVSQFAPNLCDLANGCRQIIITPYRSVLLLYSVMPALVSAHFDPAMGCLKI